MQIRLDFLGCNHSKLSAKPLKSLGKITGLDNPDGLG